MRTEEGAQGRGIFEEAEESDRVHQGAQALVLGPPQSQVQDSGTATNQGDQEEGVVHRPEDAARDFCGSDEADGYERHGELRMGGRGENDACPDEEGQEFPGVQIHDPKARDGFQVLVTGTEGANDSSAEGRQTRAASPRSRERQATSLAGGGGARRADGPAGADHWQRQYLLQGAEQRAGDADRRDQVQGVDARQVGAHRVGDDLRSENGGRAAQTDADASALDDREPRVPHPLHEQRAGAADLAVRNGEAGTAAAGAARVARPDGEGVAALLEYIEAQSREHAHWRQQFEMQLSEEKTDHARTLRLKRELEKRSSYWSRKCEAARAEARGANVRASEAQRNVTAAEQEMRRANFRILSLERQLSLLNDVVPRAELVKVRSRLESTVAEQAEQIAARRGLFSWAGVHEVGGPGATRADAHPHHRHDLSVVSGVLFLTGSSSRQSQRRRKCSEECMYHPNPSTCQTKLQM